jgi:superfamily II DNA or RNA helicase
MTYKRHQHQDEGFTAIQEAINSCVHRMQILYPTGGGKTNTEIDAINFYFQKCEQEGRFGVAVVMAPRIQLCIQHMKEHTFNPLYSVKFHPMALHSGRKDIPEEYLVDEAMERDIVARVSKEFASVKCVRSATEITDECARVQQMDKHFIIFATYHSADKLAASGIPLDLIIADESQYLVTTEFSKLHSILTAKHWLFFTATQKVTTSTAGLGMNNPALFGDVIYQVEPKTLIERGIIVEPRLHIMYADGIRADGVTIASKKKSNDHDRESNYDAVKEIIEKQGRLTVGYDEKILVACKDAPEVAYLARKFIGDSSFEDYAVFYTSSDAGNFHNRKKLTRGEFLTALNARKGKALIFHYDILSEGIDVDGISGVVFLRAMGIAKTLQTIGRAVRVLKNERCIAIEQRVKQKAWVSVPLVFNGGVDSEDYQSVKKILLDIVTAMIVGGLKPEKVTIHRPRGAGEDVDGTDPLVEVDPKSTTFSELFDLDAIKHEIMQKLRNEESGMLSVYMAEAKNDDEFFNGMEKTLNTV